MSEEKEYMFSVVAFDGADTAEKALKKVRELKKEGKFQLEDVVAVTKNEKGKVKLKQGRNLTGKKGTLGFGGAGLIAGTLLGGPIVGAAIGASLGAAGSQVKKIFGNDELKEIGESLDQNSSLLFLMTSEHQAGALEGVVEEFGGKIHEFFIAKEGLVAMGAITEDEAFLAVMQEEIVEIELEDECEDDECEKPTTSCGSCS
jgi:uncharacterized membrane protein